MLNCLAVVSVVLFCTIGTARSQSPSCSRPDADVLILGAGISGITAAHTLSANNISNFLILEAQLRIGGRIRQANLSSGVKVEVGANWIQGLDPNDTSTHPFYSILNRCGVDMANIGIISNYSDLVVYNSTGQRVNDSELARRCEEFLAARAAAEESVPDRLMNDISVREGLTMSNWSSSTSEDIWVEWFGFDWCFGETPDVTSLHFSSMIESYSETDETADFFVTDQNSGYVQVVDCLAKEFLKENDPRLHLNTTVNKVQWSDDCVCVEADESGETRTYCAPYAISTFSIGVLQHFEQNGRFEPPLPQSKLDPINTFNMTHFLPMFAEFTNSFWDDVEYIGYASDERGYFTLFQPLDKFFNDDVHVLLATFTDQTANRLANQPIENSIAELKQVLGTIYGPENVTEPTNVLIPDWDVNELFFGAWTNIPIGVTAETITQLAAPVGRLYFSGEATSVTSIGFSHGAYMAGIDSANTVIRAIEENETTSTSPTSQAVKNTSASMLCLTVFSIVVIGLWQ